MTSILDLKNLTPELDILIWSAGVNPEEKFLEGLLKNSKIKWSELVQQGITHGILPLLYSRLKNLNPDRVPIPEIKKLKSIYLINAGRNLIRANRIENLYQLMEKHQIELVFFKGAVLAVQAFGDLNLRNFCDIDVLIKSQDFARVYDLMESSEYQPIKPAIGNRKKIWTRTRRNFEFKDETGFYDFHQQVIQGPRFFWLRDCFQNHTTVKILTRPVPALNVEDSVIMLALHGTHHGWNILKFVADLAHMIYSNESEINWDTLILKARAMGCLRMVMIGLLLGQDFCGMQIPPVIQDLIQNDKKTRKLAVYFTGKILEKEESNLIPVMAIPRSLDSLYYQFRYMIYYVFNPTNLDVLALRLPGFMYPLYYLIRPLRLGINLLKEAVSKIVKRKDKDVKGKA
jgi:hypothetical protein